MRGATSWGDGESCPGGGRCLKSGTLAMYCHTAGAVGSANPAKHCLTAWGQWAVVLLQCTAPLAVQGQWAVQLVQCTGSLPEGSGQWNSCGALPHCLKGRGSGTLAMYCLNAWGQWAVQLLQCTATLPGGRGRGNSCNAVPQCLGAVGNGTPAKRGPTSSRDNALPHSLGVVGSATPGIHCLTAWGQWAVELRGSGQCNSCNALPHRLGAASSGIQ